MNTLTKREKTLLYILLCVVIFVGGIFLMIMPAMERQSELSSELDNVELNLVSAKAALPDYSTLDKDIKEATKAMEAIEKKFYARMKNEDVDELITNMTISHGLTPLTLNINPAVEEEVLSFADFIAKLENAESDSTKKEKDPNKTLRVYNVALTVDGTITNLQRFVNEANKSKSMKINSVSYSEQDENKKEMSVSFKIFLL